ncbi:two-component sensor histidine kinase [Halovibrio salipaludis]|uniref:histidine kinase n=1 Tax=Halovibrio salipaludis TaxID=2032626 RepID=A0A2A2F627_9GAMM|nr:ATP-binding protein [Halovibrio salipaludis]PAU80055.1 two-component sensor histidine kinase [Halovibrio salipaludis]
MSLGRYYLRVYGALILVALGVTLVGAALVVTINGVREQAFLEHHPRPVLDWLAQHPRSVDPVNARVDSSRLRLLPRQAVSLNDVARERLEYGQVLAQRRGDAVYFYRLAPDAGVLELRAEDPYRHVAELAARTLVHVAERSRGSDPAAMGAALGVHATPLETPEQLPGPAALGRIANGGIVYHQPSPREPAHSYAALGDGTLVSIAHPSPFRYWSWPLALVLAGLVAAVLGAVVYYLLAGLHRRLRGIEGAVSRIARGELDARVSEEGDYMGRRLAGAFNRMAEHIQRLVSVQSEMIHGVSHELRTPVARIRFGVQMIEDCEDPEMLRSQLGAIDGDIQELDELIDEILTYARLEQGGPIMAVQRLDIADIVDQVIEEQQSIHPELRVESDIPEDSRTHAEADAEPRYIHRAIQNLVGNAARYASERVLVACHFDDQTMRIDVQDDGKGIPEEDWDKVFTAFARLDDSRTRSSGGYGLGLSIVRRILYWHGGQAFVGRSETLGGACFTLVWPRHQPRDQHEGSARTEDPS